MKLERNSRHISNTKSIWVDKNRDLENELNFYLQETWKELDTRTKVYKPRIRKSRWNELKHHKIK